MSLPCNQHPQPIMPPQLHIPPQMLIPNNTLHRNRLRSLLHIPQRRTIIFAQLRCEIQSHATFGVSALPILGQLDVRVVARVDAKFEEFVRVVAEGDVVVDDVDAVFVDHGGEFYGVVPAVGGVCAEVGRWGQGGGAMGEEVQAHEEREKRYGKWERYHDDQP